MQETSPTPNIPSLKLTSTSSATSNESELRLLELCESLRPPLQVHHHPRFKVGKVEHELSDVLLVAGAVIVLFSDKAGVYHVDKDEDIAWGRWYKKRIASSIHQLRGAEKSLKRGTPVFTRGPGKGVAKPIPLPDYSEAEIYLVAVTRGASEVVKWHKMATSASMTLSSRLSDCSSHGKVPFTYERLDDGGRYVHLLDEEVLEHFFEELQTIEGVASYFRHKEVFLRQNEGKVFPGEDALLGHYLQAQEKMQALGVQGSPFDLFPAVLSPSALTDWKIASKS